MGGPPIFPGNFKMKPKRIQCRAHLINVIAAIKALPPHFIGNESGAPATSSDGFPAIKPGNRLRTGSARGELILCRMP